MAYDWLQGEPDTWILTPNRRMSQFLQAQLAMKMQASSYDAGHILPMSTWLQTLWRQEQVLDPELRPIITPHAATLLWEKIIADHSQDLPLLPLALMARLSRDAWNMGRHWLLLDENGWLISSHTTAYSLDVAHFRHWAKAYAKHPLHFDEADALAFLIKAQRTKAQIVCRKVILVGFTELTPLWQLFLDALAHSGTALERRTAFEPRKGAQVLRLKATSELDEWHLAAQWARTQLEQQAAQRLAVVVPQLEYERARVEKIFQSYFHKSDYNIAAPLPLSHYPLIQDALACLALSKTRLELDTLCHVLRSPFVRASGDAGLAGAELAHFLEMRLEPQFNYQAVMLALRDAETRMPLAKRYRRNLQKIQTLQEDRAHSTPQHWIGVFRKILQIMGWPGERSLDSNEHQVAEQWPILLDAYAALAGVLGMHSLSEARHRLEELAFTSVFLPQSAETASVQILGLLEAVGTPFDGLWVCGLDDMRWPVDPKPNPLLPLKLQKQVHTPHASAARELQVASALTEQLSQAAPRVIFSIHSQKNDERYDFSPLLLPISQVSETALLGLSGAPDMLRALAPGPHEYIADLMGPALSTQDPVLGGTRFLKLQSLCPFRAFSEIRLQARPPQTPQLGLSKAFRGEIIHLALEHSWKGIQSQAALQVLDPKQLTLLVELAIHKALSHYLAESANKFGTHYLQLEKKRLSELLIKWFDQEKKRPSFIIKHFEYTETIERQGVRFTVRIDRIDEVAGEQIIIDYKTGKCHIQDWVGPRLKDPQLPIYCISREPKPSALAFGIIRSDQVGFKGLAQTPKHLPGTQKQLGSRTQELLEWSQQVSAWQTDLDSLIESFRAGHARVDPLEHDNTCRSCHLTGLCRRFDAKV